MEIKRNESTLNRPEGDRVLDAPYVFFDIAEYARQIKEEEAWQKNDRNAITVFKTGQQTIVVAGLHTGAIQRENLVDGILTIHVIEGNVRVTTPDGDMELRQNQVIAFHRCIDHSIQALENSIILLTNHTLKEESQQ
ncbi:MAG TPA: hypothetical protein VFO70_10555 [Chitinophagaceae bacterium]|nr:hypothetical protein [Chitinophagaceae bacterium]